MRHGCARQTQARVTAPSRKSLAMTRDSRWHCGCSDRARGDAEYGSSREYQRPNGQNFAHLSRVFPAVDISTIGRARREHKRGAPANTRLARTTAPRRRYGRPTRCSRRTTSTWRSSGRGWRTSAWTRSWWRVVLPATLAEACPRHNRTSTCFETCCDVLAHEAYGDAWARRCVAAVRGLSKWSRRVQARR